MDFLSLFKHETGAINFSAGETIIEFGKPIDAMYVLMEGEAEIRLGDQVVYVAKSGDLLGELALIDHVPSSTDVVAMTSCRLVAIDERRFQFLVQQTPNFAITVMRVIASRLRGMNGRLGHARA
jgi:CRP-like cAMP-binding protein